jgi:hypothetical protein
MSDKTNDKIREQLQEELDEADIPSQLRHKIKKALEDDDLEEAIDLMDKGDYSEDYPIGGMAEPYDIEKEKGL